MEEEEQLNNKVDNTTDESDESEEEDEHEDDNTPFHKHPRWLEIQSELKTERNSSQELVKEVDKLREIVDKLQEKLGDEDDPDLTALQADLEELENNRPDTIKDTFLRFRKLMKKEAKIKEDTLKADKAAETNKAGEMSNMEKEKAVKEYRKAFDNLVESKSLEAEEVPKLAKWMASKFDETGDKTYLDVKKSFPIYTKDAEIQNNNKNKKAQQDSRTGIKQPSGDAGDITISPEKLRDMTFEEKYRLAAKHKE